jgi:hypothetical protein
MASALPALAMLDLSAMARLVQALSAQVSAADHTTCSIAHRCDVLLSAVIIRLKKTRMIANEGSSVDLTSPLCAKAVNPAASFCRMPTTYITACKAYMLCLACNGAFDDPLQSATAATATPARQGATPSQTLASLRRVALLAAALATTPGMLRPARALVSELQGGSE